MNDKIARLNNMFKKELYDKMDDDLLDLINYSIYLYLIRKNMLIKEKRGKLLEKK